MKIISKIGACTLTVMLFGVIIGGAFPALTYAGSGSNTPPSSGSGSNTSQGGTGSQRIVFTNPSPYNTVMELLRAVLNAIVRILMPVIAIMFIVSGFLFVTAGGNEKKLEDAKKAFFGTVIGAAIVLGAWALATAIAGTIQRL